MSRVAAVRLASGGMHPDRVRGLVERFGNAERVVRALGSGRLEVSDAVRAAVGVPGADRLTDLANRGIGFFVDGEAGYPEAFGPLPDRPPWLFVRGMLPEGPAVALVGTRRCSAYGRRVAEAYGAALAGMGVVVVSGLARGIDGAAHSGTVAAGGRAVAVLGCGIDRVYPSEHARLARAILDGGGAVVSEYPPGAPPLAWRFPPRNRIISGLSQAVVVVEANRTGGALITARHALIQGREVLATPGDITRPSSVGCNLLIRDGAIPVLDAEDLIEAMSLLLGVTPLSTTKNPTGVDPELWAAIGTVGVAIPDLADRIGIEEPALRTMLAELESRALAEVDGNSVRRSRQ